MSKPSNTLLTTAAVSAILIGASAFSLSPQASAQASGGTQSAPPAATGDQPGQGLEEIVVTARRVSERLQQVPVSITAFTARALSDQQISQVNDLKGSVPNLITQQTATPGASVDIIRGVPGQGLPNVELDNRVGIYLDGVYLARVQGASFPLADIQQIEVLKGPQGTLFGRNVTAGAISFTTPEPTGEFGGQLETGFGNYDRQRYRATINTPEFDGFSARVTFVHESRDGDVKNSAAGRLYGNFYSSPGVGYDPTARGASSTLGATNDNSVFAAVRYRGIDDLTVDYKFDYTFDRDTPISSQLLGFPGSATGCVGAALYLGKAIDCGGPFNTHGLPATSSAANNVPVSFSKLSRLPVDFQAPNFVHNTGHNLTVSYDINSDLTLKSITAYRQVSSGAQVDLDGGDYYAVNNSFNAFPASPHNLPANGVTPFCVDCSVQQQEQRQFSEELQLVGHYDSYIDYIVGAYYFHEKGRGKDFFEANAVPQYAYLGFGVPPLTSARTFLPDSGFSNSDDGQISSTSVAGFAHLTGHITDQIDLSAGARLTSDHKDETVGPEIVANTIDPITGGNPPAEKQVNFSRWTYDFTATYKVTSDTNVYLRYASAYLAGGLFRNLVYRPEDTRAEEIGLKSEFLDRRMRLNLAAFHQNSINSQDNTITPKGVIIVQNIGSLETNGFEAALTAMPTSNIILNASSGYTQAKYSDGRRDPAPKWTIQLSGEYDAPTYANGMFFSFVADANYRSKYNGIFYPLQGNASNVYPLPTAIYAGYGNQQAYLTALDNAATAGGYWLANLRLNLEDIPIHGQKVRASLFVKNLFNERKPVYAQNYGTEILAQFEADRTFGLDLHYDFGGEGAPEPATAAYVPPPVVAPTPSVPHSYLVFFDFNKSDLTPQALSIVNQAAANAGPVHVTQLTVTGHTDTVGSDAYNMRLSRRRAESVASQLAKDGIPASEISIVAKGKRDQLVPTADGVREPQNRRVRIVYDGGATS